VKQPDHRLDTPATRRAPGPAPPAEEPARAVLRLQRASGNRAVARLLGGDVRVHYDSAEPARFHAAAFARGDDIHLAPGRRDLLTHEAWHVVQQREGRVPPRLRMNGEAVNDDRSLEAEADTLARGGAPHGALLGRAVSDPVVQLAALTVNALESVLGGSGTPLGSGSRMSFADTALAAPLDGLKFHVSATLGPAGSVTAVHFSYYPRDDAAYRHKVIHYEYPWNPGTDSFGAVSQKLETWKPFRDLVQAIQDHAAAQATSLQGKLQAVLRAPAVSAPIAVPPRSSSRSSAVTPPSTPPGGWADTPPSSPAQLF
jgi:hypothetical protein